MMHRSIDFLIALFISLAVFIPCLFIAIIIRLTSKGPAIFWSERVGLAGKTFLMPKFRSMSLDAPIAPTDLLETPDRYITQVGKMLRKTSIDELPQLFSVLKGDMALVGPRPVLLSQTELLKERQSRGIANLRPGITGWAQINGRDTISTMEKIKFDEEYLHMRSLAFDLKILWLTLFYVATSSGISH